MTRKALILAISLAIAISGFIFSESISADEGFQSRLQDFVNEVYMNYAQESFSKVYAVMYPSVQTVLSVEEYVEFQEYQFADLNLVISEIQVGEVSDNPRIPRVLRGLLPEDEELQVYGVGMEYRAELTSGIRINQDMSTTVYVVVEGSGLEDESLYLLWDPEVVEEEELEQ